MPVNRVSYSFVRHSRDPRGRLVDARVRGVLDQTSLSPHLSYTTKNDTIGRAHDWNYISDARASSATLTVKGAQIATGADKTTDKLHYAAMAHFHGASDQPQERFNVTFARSINIHKQGRFNKTQFLQSFQKIVENAFRAQVENGAKELVWNPFGMGAFIREYQHRRGVDAKEVEHLRAQMAQTIVQRFEAVRNGDLSYRLHLCLLTGSGEAKANFDAFLGAVDRSHSDQIIIHENGDMLEITQLLANQGKRADMIVAGNRFSLGNHWMDPSAAERAQEENAFRRMSPEFLTYIQRINIEQKIGITKSQSGVEEPNDRAMRNHVASLAPPKPARHRPTQRPPSASEHSGASSAAPPPRIPRQRRAQTPPRSTQLIATSGEDEPPILKAPFSRRQPRSSRLDSSDNESVTAAAPARRGSVRPPQKMVAAGTILVNGREYHLTMKEGAFTPTAKHIAKVAQELIAAHAENIDPKKRFTISARGISQETETFSHESAKAAALWTQLITPQDEIESPPPAIPPFNSNDYSLEDYESFYTSLKRTNFHRQGLFPKQQKMYEGILADYNLERITTEEALRHFFELQFTRLSRHQNLTINDNDISDDDL